MVDEDSREAWGIKACEKAISDNDDIKRSWEHSHAIDAGPHPHRRHACRIPPLGLGDDVDWPPS